jgi:hypothetical protein
VKKLGIATIVLGAAVAVACGSGGHVDPKPSATTVAPASPTTHVPTRPTTPPRTTPAADGETQQATKTAMDYLSGQNFSRKGLIEQLKFEGYPTKASTAAVDSLKINWNEQAALVARDYLQSQSFSKKGLKEQLEFDGFSESQAAYGVAHSGL